MGRTLECLLAAREEAVKAVIGGMVTDRDQRLLLEREGIAQPLQTALGGVLLNAMENRAI